MQTSHAINTTLSSSNYQTRGATEPAAPPIQKATRRPGGGRKAHIAPGATISVIKLTLPADLLTSLQIKASKRGIHTHDLVREILNSAEIADRII